MVKFTITFDKPTDLARFEDAYNDFLALVERMPLITRRQVNTVLGSPMGETSLYRVLEVYFDEYGHMEEALRSPAGQEAGLTLQRRFPEGSFTLIFSEVFEEQGGQTGAA